MVNKIDKCLVLAMLFLSFSMYCMEQKGDEIEEKECGKRDFQVFSVKDMRERSIWIPDYRYNDPWYEKLFFKGYKIYIDRNVFDETMAEKITCYKDDNPEFTVLRFYTSDKYNSKDWHIEYVVEGNGVPPIIKDVSFIKETDTSCLDKLVMKVRVMQQMYLKSDSLKFKPWITKEGFDYIYSPKTEKLLLVTKENKKANRVKSWLGLSDASAENPNAFNHQC